MSESMTPLELGDDLTRGRDPRPIYDPRGEIVAQAYDPHAEFIVRACNAHEELVEAAKAAFMDMGSWDGRDPEVWDALHKAV